MCSGDASAGTVSCRLQAGRRIHRGGLASRTGAFLLALGLCLVPESSALAKGTYEPPRTGLESPDRSHRMKSNPGAGALIDAYGFPVQNAEPERPRARRLPPGAYGGYGARDRERPLPDERDSRPLWR